MRLGFAWEDTMDSRHEELLEGIARLKREKNAVLLAHYYQEDAIQDAADFVGDSLELSRKALSTDAELIVFAGVYFMAETAKILNPERRVVIPDPAAGCSLVDGCTPEALRVFREEHPEHFVVMYVNSSSAAKVYCDVTCTSSNALDIVRKCPPERPILFAPDRNLGRWVKENAGRGDIDLWDACCTVHEDFSVEALEGLIAANPDAEVIAHPECTKSLLDLCHFVGSTSQLLGYVQQSAAPAFIVGTEVGIFHKMRQLAPDKRLIEIPPVGDKTRSYCHHMRRHTLEKVYQAFRDETHPVVLDEKVRTKALIPIERMMAWS